MVVSTPPLKIRYGTECKASSFGVGESFCAVTAELLIRRLAGEKDWR